MNCREIVEFLDDYYESRIEPNVLASFEEHVAACPCCGHFLLQYRQVVQAAASLKTVPCQPIPEALVAAICKAAKSHGSDDCAIDKSVNCPGQ